MTNRLNIPATICLAVAFAPLTYAQTTRPSMSYLDNGVIRIGVNLEAGGAIAYLSKSGDDTNLVNNWDWGRQVQMSHYSGPVPFRVPGKEPDPRWVGLGWNPVQAGDHFRNPSKILAHENDGRSIRVKCIPMQYALDNVPAECTFECRITLEGNAAQVTSRMVVDRPDKTQYPARSQELPAVYTIGTLHRLMTYTGDRPFTGDALTQIIKSEEEKRKGGWPWVRYQATESWAALVNDEDWGVGVWHPGCTSFVGGFHGRPGEGGTHDDPTGYISPVRNAIIDHNIAYEYRYVLIVGTLRQIREYVYEKAQRPAPPTYRFKDDRQHWYYHHATDTGWPIKGELHVLLNGQHPQLIGPSCIWTASTAPKVWIEAACRTDRPQARLFWRRHDDDRFTAEKSIGFALKPDGEFHRYEIDLSASPEYRGAITGLRFDPVSAGDAKSWIKVRSISFTRPEDAGIEN